MKTDLTVIFARYLNGERREYFAKGRVAQTLLALNFAGDNGVTALEMSDWAYRLSAYVHVLRHDFGLDISTDLEPHEGGKHARYRLVTPVEIVQALEG